MIFHDIAKRSTCTVWGFMQRLSTKLKYYSWHLQEWVRAIRARRNIQRIISRSIPTCKESWKLQSASQWMHLDIDFTFTIMQIIWLNTICNFTLMVGILPQSFWCKHLGNPFFSICCDIELQELIRDRFWSRLKVASSEVRKRPSVVLRWLADSLAMQLSSPTPMYDVLQLTSISELTPLSLYAWGIPLITFYFTIHFYTVTDVS